MGVSWASGINLYTAMAMLDILGVTGNMALPNELQILSNPLIIGSAGIMYPNVGGGIAGSAHATKSGTRVLINSSPEPATNIVFESEI